MARDRGSDRVLDLVRDAVHVESGPERLPAGDRAAIVASWGPGPEVSRSLAALVTSLDTAGYPSVVVRASDDPSPLIWPSPLPASTIVVRKPNIGYDFGSWAVGLDRFRGLAKRRHVILVNDSMVGPFEPLTEMISAFERARTDAWAATSTAQIYPHLQSYLLGFHGGMLADSAVRQFWRSVRHLDDKSLIIEEYELGLYDLLQSEGFTTSAWYPSERVVSPAENPVINGWRKLIDLGFPFVKREVVVNPSVTQDARTAPAVVRERFGVDVAEWL